METAVLIIVAFLAVAVFLYIVWFSKLGKKEEKPTTQNPTNQIPTQSDTKPVNKQLVGEVGLTNRDVRCGIGATLGMYKTDFTLDSRGDEYKGGDAFIKVEVICGGYVLAFSETYNVSIGEDEIITFGSCDTVVDLTKGSWKVLMNVNGHQKDYELRIPAMK